MVQQKSVAIRLTKIIVGGVVAIMVIPPALLLLLFFLISMLRGHPPVGLP
jgi:Fe2+ transport system protein B